ncbi:MAG: hypothetical protein ACYTXC_09590 [Nostoc sp.]
MPNAPCPMPNAQCPMPHYFESPAMNCNVSLEIDIPAEWLRRSFHCL